MLKKVIPCALILALCLALPCDAVEPPTVPSWGEVLDDVWQALAALVGQEYMRSTTKAAKGGPDPLGFTEPEAQGGLELAGGTEPRPWLKTVLMLPISARVRPRGTATQRVEPSPNDHPFPPRRPGGAQHLSNRRFASSRSPWKYGMNASRHSTSKVVPAAIR